MMWLWGSAVVEKDQARCSTLLIGMDYSGEYSPRFFVALAVLALMAYWACLYGWAKDPSRVIWRSTKGRVSTWMRVGLAMLVVGTVGYLLVLWLLC